MVDDPKGESSGNQGAASKDSGKPGQAGNLDGSIADLDFSNVPEGDRERIQGFVAEKAKQLQAGFTKKTEDLKTLKEQLSQQETNLSELRKIQEEFDKDPKLAQAVKKVYYDYRSGKLTDSKAEKHIKRIEELKSQATTLGERDSLDDLETIVREALADHKGGDVTLQDKIKGLEDQIKILSSTTEIGLSERVDRDIKSLEDRFGSEIVEKYRDKLRSFATKYPKQPMTKLFYNIADDSDVKAALLKEAEIEKGKELKNQRSGLEPAGTGVVGEIEKPRDKGGRVILGGEDGFLSRILKKHGISK